MEVLEAIAQSQRVSEKAGRAGLCQSIADTVSMISVPEKWDGSHWSGRRTMKKQNNR